MPFGIPSSSSVSFTDRTKCLFIMVDDDFSCTLILSGEVYNGPSVIVGECVQFYTILCLNTLCVGTLHT